jgi:homoserine O-succinyltransferase
MPLLLDTARSGLAVDLRGRNCLTIGLVNNMPDAACEANERQFLDLLRAATGNVIVRLKLFALADVPRAEEARGDAAGRYRDIADLWNAPLDGLIVTGTEPRAANLQDEPYWPALRQLVDWARTNTASTVWSCLAAHAAVLHADGIARQPLDEKLSGVFACEVIPDHPLLADVAPQLRVPHSRLNDLPEQALRSCGYRMLSRSAAIGVDAFVKDDDQAASLFVFFQGHPEYAADSLLREYRRDVGRFLRGERATYPRAPQDYLNDAAMFLVEDFRLRAMGARRGDLLGDFPLELASGIENTWHDAAVGLYRNWIAYLKDRKQDRISSAMIERGRVSA